MRVLSFDPGYGRLGIAIIDKNSQKEELVYSDCFSTSRDMSPEDRLSCVGAEVRRLINNYGPNAAAIEKLFFAKNQKTALRVAEARGVILECVAEAGLPVFEYGPTEIKTAITGYGRSTKNQIIMMVKKLIKIEKVGVLDDEYDAIAVGLTCFAYEKFK